MVKTLGWFPDRSDIFVSFSCAQLIDKSLRCTDLFGGDLLNPEPHKGSKWCRCAYLQTSGMRKPDSRCKGTEGTDAAPGVTRIGSCSCADSRQLLTADRWNGRWPLFIGVRLSCEQMVTFSDFRKLQQRWLLKDMNGRPSETTKLFGCIFTIQ